MSAPRVPNARTMGAAFAGPEPEWVSYGTVSDDSPVTMDPDLGPLVGVVLQPSKVLVHCRVGMQSAGKGEGEYIPFVAGDEVVVVVPEGTPWAGPVIVGRLANANARFPLDSVAGQDPSKNNFAFKRTRTAWIHEVEGGFLVREATSGAFLQLEASAGNVTMSTGKGDALQLTSSGVSYQSADAKKILQLDADNGRFRAQVDDALLLVASTSAGRSALVVPGTFSFSAAAQPAAEHVATTESVVNLVSQILAAFAAANPGPITGAALAGYLAAGTQATGVTAAALAPLHPLVAAAIQGAFATATQKPAGVPGLGQSLPGIGCAGLLAG